MPTLGFDSAEFRVATVDGRQCRLLESVTFTRRDGTIIMLPPGISTDGASTPAVLWQKIPPFGKYWRAAFLHDAAYRMKTRPIIGSKKECDDLFLEVMEICGVDVVMCKIIHEGVLRFGGAAYIEDRIG